MVSIASHLPNDGAIGQAGISAWLACLAQHRDEKDIDLLRKAVFFVEDYLPHTDKGRERLLMQLQVADILDRLQLDTDMLIAGLFCGVAAEPGFPAQQLEKNFGKPVERMVKDVARLHQLSRVGAGVDDEEQVENMRRLLLGLANDVRAIMVVLAWRLQQMRQLRYHPQADQRRMAAETLRLHAPLANRLGVWQLKWELEDLSLRFLHPEVYREIAEHLMGKREQREAFIASVIERLTKEFATLGFEADISGRPKHIYSIWKKMQRKRVHFEQIFDVRAVRVLVDTIPQCYEVLGVVHGIWQPIPGEFDDYIARPKANGYSSLHTAVVSDDGRPLEIQVRTRQMHDHAERGVAAHWRYKESRAANAELERRIEWMRQWLEQQESGVAVDSADAEFEAGNIYVLTPQGKVVELPAGATAVDFAYAIHTSVGHRCRGAKADGHIIPLTQPLVSGQMVEVLTCKEGGPSRDWLNPHAGYLASSRARNRVRHWFKLQDFDQHVQIGRQSLERELGHLNLAKPDLTRLAPKFNFRTSEELLAAIGCGELSPIQVANSQLVVPEQDVDAAIAERLKQRADKKGGSGGQVMVAGVGDLLTHMAKCCKPVPGDPVVGYITRGRGITVHRSDCQVVQKMSPESQQRLLEVTWSEQPEEGNFLVDIHVYAVDRQGLLRDISSVFSNEKIDVLGVQTQSDRKHERASMRFTVEVPNMGILSRVLDRLSQLPDVIEAKRQR